MNTEKLLAADIPGGASSQGIRNPFLPGSIGSGSMDQGLITAGKLITSLISLFLVIAVIASLLYLLMGALAWVTSDGEKGKLEQARNKITGAILGLVIVAAGWAVWALLGNFLGFDVTNLIFPTITGS